MASNRIVGCVEIADSSQGVTIKLDGDNGNLTLGGDNHDGDIHMRNKAGSITIGINAQTGSAHLGGQGQDGDLLLRNSANKVTMHLDGSGANATFGGEGQDGDLQLKNTAGTTTIHLDGQSGQIKIRDWSLRVPDCVFEYDYPLRTPTDLGRFIADHGHLPEVPSAHDVAREGVDLASFSMALLRKVEELTLYVLDQERRVAQLEAQLQSTSPKE